jgi:hypothetical protein
MTASELIVMLTEAIKEHGDLQIATYDNEYSEHDAADGVELVNRSSFDDIELAEKFFCIS